MDVIEDAVLEHMQCRISKTEEEKKKAVLAKLLDGLFHGSEAYARAKIKVRDACLSVQTRESLLNDCNPSLVSL